MFENTDKEWEKLGASDPYFGVLTSEKYRRLILNKDLIEEFWLSGEDYIDNVFTNIEKYIDDNFRPIHGLDFGCGVGRLLFAIAKRCDSATGVDVSSSMLKEASAKSKSRSITNISFIESSDCSSLREGAFDFVHSYIVFQHIPVDTGYNIFDQLLSNLRKGGVGVLHFTYYSSSKNSIIDAIKKSRLENS